MNFSNINVLLRVSARPKHRQAFHAATLALPLLAVQGCTPIYLASKAAETGASVAASVATKTVVLTAGAVTAVAAKSMDMATQKKSQPEKKGDTCESRARRPVDQTAHLDNSAAAAKPTSAKSAGCPASHQQSPAHVDPAP